MYRWCDSPEQGTLENKLVDCIAFFQAEREENLSRPEV